METKNLIMEKLDKLELNNKVRLIHYIPVYHLILIFISGHSFKKIFEINFQSDKTKLVQKNKES